MLASDRLDEQWSDAPDTGDDDHSLSGHPSPRGIEEVNNSGHEDFTARELKITADHEKNPSERILESSQPESLSPTPELASDVASVRSMPDVLVTEPQSPVSATTYPAASSTTLATHAPPQPLSRPHTAVGGSSMAGPDRRNRHRSTLEVRSSNRLSGFLNHFMPRRENTPTGSSRAREDRAPSPAPSNPPSRTSSPTPMRTITPPPQLPPPTLQELGLSFSVVTSDLSPSHFSTPPASGAFMAPHYLLLCHAQGLDVLPLVSPPAPQPYALVRRVSFKSVVVMDQRGVLVAIAGRRDGVRVYALEEVKKAVEWRMEVEVRRERERMRREASKKGLSGSVDSTSSDRRDSSDKKASLHSTTPIVPRNKIEPKRPHTNTRPSTPSTPRAPLAKKPTVTVTPSSPVAPIPPVPPILPIPPPISQPPQPSGLPPPYSSPELTTTALRNGSSLEVHRTRSRSSSVTDVLARAPSIRRNRGSERSVERNGDSKIDWSEDRDSSDDEAINIVAAASSGSQALDERTSARPLGSNSSPVITEVPRTARSTTSVSARRGRPANLDLSASRADSTVAVVPPESSPAMTVHTLRQTLSHTQSVVNSRGLRLAAQRHEPDTPNFGGDDDEEAGGGITLAQALMESRIPDLPPAGTRRPQQPILIGASHPMAMEEDEEPTSGGRITLAQMLLESRIPDLPPPGSRRPQQAILITASHPVVSGDDDVPDSPVHSEAHSTLSRRSAPERISRRRRRWSVLEGVLQNRPNGASNMPPSASNPSGVHSSPSTPTGLPTSSSTALNREYNPNSGQPRRAPHTSPSATNAGITARSMAPLNPTDSPSRTIITNSRSRFIPRIINAFHGRRSEDQSQVLLLGGSDNDPSRRVAASPTTPHAPPPKLEYVKLPGTKGSLMIKAVETAKKSFLAILCGDSGEKVELFAGTYRTALGLSRTFILPDSPRSLELQLQGDDLVEVFLVFSQNVFGLEPATVRVREVRIGRAERRAARRRAREIRTGEASTNDPDLGNFGDEDTNVNMNIGLSVSAGAGQLGSAEGDTALLPSSHPSEAPPASTDTPNGSALTHAEELVALATAQMGPYTTFQQLTFAPNFPLASIADDYIIPPTYPTFLEYRAIHEPEDHGGTSTDLSQVQFSPPGLPMPTPSSSKWCYRDPKGVVHGPWKASLMQAWYKDGLLPPDLPVRREGDAEFILLKDLRLQSVDPTHPFRFSNPHPTSQPLQLIQDSEKPLLQPLSLLSQPKHFGPPALFFSTRGGRSTTIVDARGRSVLKGRFVWSGDEDTDDGKSSLFGRMGDVRRLEAFDLNGRAVLVALRQGGLEAVDLGDALLKPADESRTVLPQFTPPPSNTNRRSPFVWKIGTPVSSSPTSSSVLSSKSKGGYIYGKKQPVNSARATTPRSDFALSNEDVDTLEEVLYLGRRGDEIYMCERNAGAFRILRLSPRT